MKSKTELGSALIYVFIGIALFSVLMFVFSRSSNQNTSSLTTQQENISASEVIDYSRQLESAVQKLILNGCSENEISFENSFVTGYSNPNAPTDKRCNVFDPAGGKVKFNTLNGIIKQYISRTPPNNIGFTTVALPGVGTASPDFVFVIWGGIELTVCSKINKNLNILDQPLSDPVWGRDADSLYAFNGVVENKTYDIASSANAKLPAFCAYDDEGNPTNLRGGYFSVLLAR